MTAIARCVVAGGRGAVGAMFVRLLIGSGVETSIVDTVDGVDIAAGGPAIAEADLVVLAVPEPVAIKAARTVAELMRPGAVLADTLSVKTRMAAELAGTTVEHVGLNPMFAPSLGMTDRPVGAVVTRDGPRVRALLRLIEDWGGRPVRFTAEEHDRTTAVSQAMTHAAILSFGLAVAESDVDFDRLAASAPPPNLALLALLARVLDGSPEVYREIQSANPHAVSARRALAEALRSFAGVVEGDGEGLAATFDRLRRLMGPDLGRHQYRCREIFTIIHHSGGGDPNP